MSRTFDFSYEGLTRNDPYEAIFIDYTNSDFNFTIKKIEGGYSVTCCFREFTLNTETLEVLSSKRQLTEAERALAHIFIREKDEYMRSPEFETAMQRYQRDLEKQYEEERRKFVSSRRTKYNIVFIPISDESASALIRLAKAISIDSQLMPNYLLKNAGKDSIPHISVFQFEIDDNISPDMFRQNTAAPLELIKKHIADTWQLTLDQLAGSEMILTLPNTINYKHDTSGAFAGVSWSEIVIDKNENPIIQFFHDRLREKLALPGIKCLNAHAERYIPHFTLFNIETAALERVTPTREIPESYRNALQTISVKPALGFANENWELTQKLFEVDSRELRRNSRLS